MRTLPPLGVIFMHDQQIVPACTWNPSQKRVRVELPALCEAGALQRRQRGLTMWQLGRNRGEKAFRRYTLRSEQEAAIPQGAGSANAFGNAKSLTLSLLIIG